MAAFGADRIAVDPFGRNLLSSAPLQRLVDTQDERSIWHKGLHQQSQENAACILARPDCTAEHPVVEAELPFLLQADGWQSGGYGPLSRRKDRTCEQQLDILPDSFREQWRKGCQKPYQSWLVG
jgi:hypothetical protein